MRFIILSILLMFCSQSFAQDSLLLMSGRMISLEIKSVDDDIIYFKIKNKKGKIKEGFFLSDEVYSFTKKGEEPVIVYVQDIENGDIYTPSEHRFYIHGMQDARNGYSTRWNKAVGFLGGVATPLYMGSGYKTLVFPLLYSGGMQIPFIKAKASTISDPAFKDHESYRKGYEKTARAKKFVASFTSSFVGLIVGTVIYEATR